MNKNDNCLRHLADNDCNTSALHIENLSFSYHNTAPILEDISLCLHNGVFLGVIGPNGGGKSTLIRLTLNLLKQNSGTIKVYGEDTQAGSSWKSKVGYVPQYVRVEQNFPATALDVVTMATQNSSFFSFKESRILRRTAMEQLDLCGVANLAHRPIGDMSGGQRQRVFIARALLNSPKLLLLDEPVNGVDSQGQHDFLTLLRNLQEDLQLSILMVSHDVGQLCHYADRIACINKRLHWHDKATLLTDNVVRRVFDCELCAWQDKIADENNLEPVTCTEDKCTCHTQR